MFGSDETPAVLTDRQLQVLGVVRDHLRDNGYPPTVREIGQQIGVTSSSTVHAHLAALEKAGAIVRDPSKPRALRVRDVAPQGPPAAVVELRPVGGPSVPRQVAPAERSDEGLPRIGAVEPVGQRAFGASDEGATQLLPLLGEVAAGLPVVAEEHVEDHIPTPRALVRGGDSFLLRISGDSMLGAGIHDGDLVVVQRRATARDGEIVIALVDDEATCKRFFVRRGRVVLQAENPDYPSIIPAEAPRILGVVSGLMRAM